MVLDSPESTHSRATEAKQWRGHDSAQVSPPPRASREFSAAQLQQIASLIAAALPTKDKDKDRASHEKDPIQQATTAGQKLLKWPEWNGSVISFPLFMARLDAYDSCVSTLLHSPKTCYCFFLCFHGSYAAGMQL